FRTRHTNNWRLVFLVDFDPADSADSSSLSAPLYTRINVKTCHTSVGLNIGDPHGHSTTLEHHREYIMAIFLRENPTFGQQALTEQISKINHMISIAFNLDTMT